ncbi:MAG: NAD(P)H-hydrate dehydratase [Dehalococcoidia bacterium]|jgi:NAD(P)H-hydrate epimerase|nr:NAD(P)H-hydrate dehydratase [Dehalococcoidia bacterium]
MRVSTVEEMRGCDRRATEVYGLSEEILMENAGQALYEVLKSEFGLVGRRFVVLCGGGNNGGDGLVVARKLHSRECDVRVCLLVDEDSLQGAPRRNLEAAMRAGIPVQRIRSADELGLGRPCDVVVDALFGTGLSRCPEGLFADVIEALNASSLSVVAADIPSGVSGDTGATPGVAVRATCTVTFGLPKRGNLLPPGRELGGKLFVSHICFPPALYASVGGVVTNRLTPLPPRPMECHKRDFGDVLFLAGSRTYLGAPLFAVRSFLRTGGGYARLAAPASVLAVLGAHASEAVMVPLRETDSGSAALSNLDELCAVAESVDLLVVGPGVSLDVETQELVRSLVSRTSTPVLIDGDGITAVAAQRGLLRERAGVSLLTPHTGEMARLLDTTVDEVRRDRVDAVQRAARDFGAVVLLKGASTLVCGPDGPVSLNLSGNPGMATAGCGDVLSGAIAALHGMGLELRVAAEVGAFIHGMAGDLAARHVGQDGLTATDVMEHMPAAVRGYREGFRELQDNHYGCLNVI